MPISISQAQANYLKKVHLDQIGTSKGDIKPVKLDVLEQFMVEMAIMFKVLAEKNLSVADAINTNKLSESIQITDVEYLGNTYSVDIKVLDYYKFVDKGVQGLNGGNTSPYKFKNLGVSRKFMLSIKHWVIREGLKARAKPVTIKHAIGQEKKGVRFKDIKKRDEAEKIAWGIAKNIKKKGLKATNFWTDTEVAIRKKMQEEAGNIFAVAVINELTNSK
jgi:hypothetical protein